MSTVVVYQISVLLYGKRGCFEYFSFLSLSYVEPMCVLQTEGQNSHLVVTRPSFSFHQTERGGTVVVT